MKNFNVKIFADGADKNSMLDAYRNPLIKGFTTNPTLMRKAGIMDYAAFARDILDSIHDKPISFEVFADDFPEMERQARLIASWGKNVYVKIPITNTRAESSLSLIQRLSQSGIKVNVTAMTTFGHIQSVVPLLNESTGAYVSIFAGRLADAGVDPVPVMRQIVQYLRDYPSVELIWASPREVLNIVQANETGCHIITLTQDLINKIPLLGKDLIEFSLDTVKMFRADAQKAGYSL